MAEGFLKGSLSAEGINKQGKPGKLSSNLLSTFESGGPLTRPHSLPMDRFPGPVPGRLGAHSFTSSSEEVMVSRENLKEKKYGVTIKVPEHEHLSPSSTDEDILSDSEELEGKKKRKRKSRWKWSPFKKMRNLFRRKKSPPRAKSCEQFPVEPTNETGVDDSLRNRTKSEPSLAESGPKTLFNIATVHAQRTQSDSPRQPHVVGKPLGLNKTKRNQQDTSEGPAPSQPQSSDETESRPGSMSALDWSLISLDSGAEGAVSFETLPSASSLEGLHVAHDKIKVAPKHRRPPSRAQAKSSSMNLKSNPSRPHRRSKTAPQDLLGKGVQGENNQVAGSNRSSDVVNKTIDETPESVEQQTKESVVADMKAKASEILSKLSESQEHLKTKNTTDADAVNKEKIELKEEKNSKPMKSSTNFHEKSKIQKPVKPKVIENADTRMETESDAEENKEQRATKVLTDQEKDKEMGIITKEQTEDKTAISNVNSEGNKENEMEEDQRILSSGSKDEDNRNGEAILREVNGLKDEKKPSLDKNKKSLSNKSFELKDSTTEQVKPVVRKGMSLNSIGHYSIESIANDPGAKPKAPTDKTKGIKDDPNDRNISAEMPTNVYARKQEANTTQSAVNVLKRSSSSHGTSQEVKLREKAQVKKKEPAVSASGQPAWIELANRRSKRYSQLLEDADQTATQKPESVGKVLPEVLSNSVDNKNNSTVTVQDKPNVASKPSATLNKSHSLGARTEKKTMFRRSLVEESHGREKTGSSSFPDNSQTRLSRSQEPNSNTFANSSANKSNTTIGTSTEKPKIALKPNEALNKTVVAGQVHSKGLTNRSTEKKAMFRKSLSEEEPGQDKQPLSSSFRGRSALLEKCVVCGNTVYQMEKCNFDNSVFHRKCIKCTVCKRLLTVGNFVVSEKKVYCKSHGQALIVSM